MGRPCRADARATCKVRVAMTPTELARVRALARANYCNVSDLIRLAVQTLHADMTDGEAAPVILGGTLQTGIMGAWNCDDAGD